MSFFSAETCLAMNRLLLVFTENYETETEGEEFLSFIKSFELPILDKQVIADFMQEMPQKSYKDLKTEPLKANFQYSSSQIKTYHDTIVNDPTYLGKCIPIVVKNALAFIFSYYDNQTLEIILNMIYTLQDTQYKDQFHDLFYITLDKMIEQMPSLPPNNVINNIIALLETFSLNNEIYFDASFRLCIKMFELEELSYAESFLPMITKTLHVIMESGRHFNEEIVCQLIRKRLKFFEPNIFILFAEISQGKESERVKTLFKKLSRYLFHYGDVSVSKFKIPDVETIKFAEFTENTKYNTTDFHHNVKYSSLFNSNVPGVNSNIDFSDLLDQSYFSTLQSIQKVIQVARSVYAELFFNRFCNYEYNNQNIHLYLCLLFLLKESSGVPKNAYSVLISDAVFNPSINMFYPTDNFEELGFIRQTALEIISTKMPILLPQTLEIHAKNPFLFSEICMRIQSLIKSGVTFTDRFFKIVISVEHKYRKIYELSEDSKDIIVQARSAIFVLIYAILNTPTITESCFTNESFSACFLTAFFEPYFQDLVFQKLRSVFQTTNADSAHTAEFVANSLKILKFSSNTSYTTNLASKLLVSVVESIPTNPSIVKYCHNVMKNAIDYTHAFPSESFLTQVMNMFLQMILYDLSFEADLITSQKLSKIIRDVEGENITDSTKQKLLSFLLASQSVHQNFLSLIIKPKILTIMFSVYSKGKHFKELFKLLNDLISYSSYNIFMMHKGEVDLILCDMVQNYPTSFEFRGCQIDNFDNEEECINLIMPLFNKIVTMKSSTIVAQRLLNILYPKNGEFNNLVFSFLSQFFMMVKSMQNQPTILYPIALCKNFGTISSISVNEFFDQETINFWIKADMALATAMNKKIMILKSMYSSGGEVFDLFIHQLNVMLEIYLPDKVASFCIAELTNSAWNCLSVVFRRISEPKTGKKSIRVTTKLNKNAPQSTSIEDGLTNDSNIIIHFGYNSEPINNDQEKLICSYQVSGINAYSKVLSNEEAESIFVTGVGTMAHDAPLIFSYDDRSKSKATFVDNFTQENIHQIIPNLIDIFMNYIPLQTFVPIFGMLKDSPKDYACVLVDFMMYCFGKRIIEVVDEIPNYILQSPTNILTFQLYRRFYNILDSLKSIEDISKYVNSILINGEIWGRAPPSTIQKVVSHWSTALVELIKDNKSILTLDFYNKILTIYRRHLYFTKTDPAVNSPYDREEEIDGSMIMFCFDRFVNELAQILNNNDVIELFITHGVFCDDKKLAARIWGILPTLFHYYVPPIEIAQKMHLVNLLNQKEFIFILLYSMQMFYPSELYNQCIILGFHLPPDTQYEDICSPEGELDPLHAFPVILIVSLRSEPDVQTKVLEKYEEIVTDHEKSAIIISHSHWYLWFIIFILQVDPVLHPRATEVLSKLILTSFDSEVVERIFGHLDVLRITTTFQTVKIKALITKSLCESLKDTKEYMPFLISFCFSSLFMRMTRSLQNDSLIGIGLESEFVDDWTSSALPKKLDKLTSFNQIKYIFDLPPKLTCSYRLQLADTANVPNSQQYIVNYLLELLDKTPLFTPILHVIQLISRYPRGNHEKKALILKIISEREFLVLQGFLNERFQKLESICNISHAFFEMFDNKLININNTYEGLSDPALKRISDINEFEKIIAEKIKTENFLFDVSNNNDFKKSLRHTPTFDCCQMKKYLVQEKVYEKTDKPQNCMEGLRIKLLKEYKIYIETEKKKLNLHYNGKKVKIFNDDVTAILWRSPRQIPSAVEIYLKNGKSYLIDFYPQKNINFINLIKEFKFQPNTVIQTENYKEFVEKMNILQKWEKGDISTYNFLLLLNIYSGRSFSSPNYYPIFPLIDVDFEEIVKRDFSMPLAAQTPAKQNLFRSQWKQFSQSQSERFIFGASMSSPIFLSSYLYRIEPFTSLNKKLHKGELDKSDYLFNSITNICKLMKLTNENREATPEFFSLPEAFENLRCENNDYISWCYNNRKMLNDPSNRANVASWVDLVFGFAQRGEEAEKRINVYLPFLYEDVWDNFNGGDKKKDMAIEMIMTLGMIPPQIFTEKLSIQNNLIQSSDLEVFRQIDLSKFIQNISIKSAAVYFEKKTMKLAVLATNNSLTVCTVNILKKNVTTNKPIDLNNKSLIASTANSFVYYDLQKLISSDSNSTFPELHGIEHIDLDGEYIAAADANGIMNVIQANSKEILHLNVFCDAIKIIKVSEKFGIAVAATADNTLSIFSISDKILLKKIQLQGFVQTFEITNDFGFIVCTTSLNLYIITPNGTVAKTVRNVQDISIICSWISPLTNNDYVCTVDSAGSMTIFEAFVPQKVMFTASAGGRVVSMRYDYNLLGLIVVTQTGNILFFPFA